MAKNKKKHNQAKNKPQQVKNQHPSYSNEKNKPQKHNQPKSSKQKDVYKPNTKSNTPNIFKKSIQSITGWDILFIIVLLGITLYFSFFKADFIRSTDYYTNAGTEHPHETDTMGMFWSETAFQYRYAKMIAEGEEDLFSVLSHDTQQQYPEGVNAFQEYTLFMEYVHGLAYRIFCPKTVPFFEFLIDFVCFYTSLMILLIYLVIRILWRRPVIAFISSLIYPLVATSYARLISGVYLKEDFTLLLFFLFVGLFFLAVKHPNRVLAILSGIIVWIVLVSWHLAQFYVFLVYFVFACLYLLKPNADWNRGNLFIIGIFTILAGFMPVLFVRGFLISMCLITLYALVLTWYLPSWLKKPVYSKRIPQTLLFFGIFILLMALSFVIPLFSKEYSHVFTLGLYKLWYGVTPDDPTGIPFDVLVFWAGNFNTSDWHSLWTNLWMFLPIGYAVLLAFPILIYYGKATESRLYIYILTLASLLLGFFIQRLLVFYAPFMMLTIGAFLSGLVDVVKDRSLVGSTISSQTEPIPGYKQKENTGMIPLLIGSIVLGAGLIVNVLLTYQIATQAELSANRSEPQSYQQLIQWIKLNTKPDEAILTDLGDSNLISYYANRPVVLNSQFENAFIREKYQAYFNSLFEPDESTFYQLAHDQWNATYFIYKRKHLYGTSKPSSRWRAGKAGPLDKDCFLAKLHFFPTELTHLTPVYDDDLYRIFRILEPGEDPNKYRWDSRYSAYFSLQTTALQGALENGFVDIEERSEDIHKISELAHEAQDIYFSTMDMQPRIRQAKQKFNEILSLDPNDWTVYMNLAAMEMDQNNVEEANRLFVKAEQFAPNDHDVQLGVISTFYALNQLDEIIERESAVLRYQPHNTELLYYLGMSRLKRQEQARASELLNRFITQFRVAQPIDKYLGMLLYQATGQSHSFIPKFYEVIQMMKPQ